MDPKLVAAYEANNLGGTTLLTEIAALERAEQELGRAQTRANRFLVALILFVVGFLGALPFVKTIEAGIGKWGLVAIMAVLALTLFGVAYYLAHEQSKKLAIREAPYPIPHVFLDVAANLLDNGALVVQRYDELAVHRILVVAAQRLLYAEQDFQRERMNPKARTSVIVRLGTWEEHCRAKLGRALEAAEKFGITPDKAQLFEEAAKLF